MKVWGWHLEAFFNKPLPYVTALVFVWVVGWLTMQAPTMTSKQWKDHLDDSDRNYANTMKFFMNFLVSVMVLVYGWVIHLIVR